jgi:hypothetical protein
MFMLPIDFIAAPPPISDIGRIYRHRAAVVIAQAAFLCNVSRADILSGRRYQPYFHAKCLVVWTLRNFRKDLSYPQIARILKMRDHSSAMHQFSTANYLIQTDIDFAYRALAIANFIRGGAQTGNATFNPREVRYMGAA